MDSARSAPQRLSPHRQRALALAAAAALDLARGAGHRWRKRDRQLAGPEHRQLLLLRPSPWRWQGQLRPLLPVSSRWAPSCLQM